MRRRKGCPSKDHTGWSCIQEIDHQGDHHNLRRRWREGYAIVVSGGRRIL